jgi:hypothetical protein
VYDKLMLIKHNIDFLTETRQKIEESNSIEEIDKYIKIFRSNISNYKILK